MVSKTKFLASTPDVEVENVPSDLHFTSLPPTLIIISSSVNLQTP
jgi:hypothetical protein